MPEPNRETVSLSVPGTRLQDPPLPRLLAPATRGGELRGEDPFLPAGFLKVESGFDLTGPSRDVGGSDLNPLTLPPDRVMVLEMVEGITVITSAGNLVAALEQRGEGSLQDLEDRGLAGAASRNIGAAHLVTRLFSLDLGSDAILEEARAQALAWARQRLGEKAKQKLAEVAELGVSWLGTKALMGAIEKRLRVSPGLYRWSGRSRDPAEGFGEGDPKLAQEARQGPLLVFIHGTGSNGAGSFGDLQESSEEDWRALRATYGERVYTFEHRTFSESPIDNALALARILPAGARIHLVTHSRGGLVGDLLCLRQIGDDLIDAFRPASAPIGAGDPGRRESLAKEGEWTYAEQRERLRELRTVLGREHGFRIERYVRVAAPCRGTLLASGNLDAFLSALLTLLGTVPYLAGNPIYSCLKRVVLEIARHRTDPRLVPGIEAMLPEAPLGRFLARATPAESVELAVIAGDIEGGHLLKRLGVLFTDFVFFEGVNNDLVVDTDSMGAGIARAGKAHQLLEQGPRVSHFNYFANASSRGALRRWLTEPKPSTLTEFDPLPGLFREREVSLDSERAEERSLRSSRGVDAAAQKALPVVVVVPDLMGSHLRSEASGDRVWFDPEDLANGGLEKIAMGEKADPSVRAEKLFDLFYGDLCRELIDSHRVVRFAYDWRLPLQNTAAELARCLQALLKETAASGQPVRILAHGMGGLVVRALFKTHEPLWNEVMGRNDARFVMLGTPNHGTHQMVETLLGKSDMIRKLARLDGVHTMQEILSIVAGFPGLLQLLPKPGFVDAGGVPPHDYFKAETWKELKERNQDRWIGDHMAATPPQTVLDQARWLWDQEGPELPETHKVKVVYVAGQACMTPCGLLEQKDRLKMLGTPAGDGVVSWASGSIAGIGCTYAMPLEHGSLCSSAAHFPALLDLLATGTSESIELKPLEAMPKLRSATDPVPDPVAYDAGPIPYPSEEEVALALLGGRRRQRIQPRPAPCLQVCCKAMDLRFVTQPLMVGHYGRDAISGPEAVIDRELVGNELSMRHRLGLYAGAAGTATVVLLNSNVEERRRGRTRGAVVIGLGTYGELTAVSLTEAVRVGTLRYLLQMVDRQSGEAPEAIEAPLSALLLGYNSTTNISVEDSVAALVRGVLAANHQFAEARPHIPVRVSQLEIVELYLDIAVTAARALVRVAEQINRDGSRYGMRVEAARELLQGKGSSQRLDASQSVAYWPRLAVTDADQNKESPQGSETLAAKPRRSFAEELRFTYLGQRARSETTLHQRQPGLVESLVESSIRESTYVKDLSRTLFQLLIPHDFKNQARQMDRVVLVLDAYTANLPWELLLADDKPLALSMRMVRQLQSPRYRTHVRQTLEKRAYVIGNPSTQGFSKVFADGATRQAPEALDSLEGAANEAQTVVTVLRRHGYECEEAIGGEAAVDIINKLYRSLYRIVHIAAHGVYDEKTRDGGSRSGVVLSDGLLITAAEIGAMETVPDLVFLNCCHLAKADARPVAFNRLAYSISRELIEMGVRAVVAAGWAVDDGAARVFAEEFYAQILSNRPFGDAVFAARTRTHEEFPTLNTWGAYQAYGDPSFVIDPLRDRADLEAEDGWNPVTHEELIQQLRGLATKAAGGDPPSTERRRELAHAVEKALEPCPEGWKRLPAVCFALGEVYAELGDTTFEKAREQYLAAIRPEDTKGAVPIRAIEQLANLEARTGFDTTNEILIRQALERLEGLVQLAGAGTSTISPATKSGKEAPPPSNPERAALMGSTYKRLAAVLAGNLLRAQDQEDATENTLEGERILDALARAIDWYGRGGEQPYQVLNRLGLEAVRNPGLRAKPVAIKQARECARHARTAWQSNPDFWNAVMPADALLTERLLDHSLGVKGKSGSDALARVQKAYTDALAHVPGTPRERDSVVKHLRILQVLFEAQGRLDHRLASRASLIAERLDLLALQMQEPAPSGGDDDGANGDDGSEIVTM